MYLVNYTAFNLLCENVKLNELTNVTVINCAVYSQKKKIKFYLNDYPNLINNHYGTVIDRIDKFSEKGFNKVVEVEANTLDEILLDNKVIYDKVKWIKIDVEGAEFEVLKGAKDLLSGSTNLSILIEIHNLSRGNNLNEEITEYLKKYGFSKTYEERHNSGEAHVIFAKT
ncbi:MAG: FkbM family methyltransferase [Candidatus Nitrosocosmicus sp.]